MKRLLTVFLLAFASFLVAPVLHAQSAAVPEVSDLYLRGYVLNNEAIRLEGSGALDQALAKFKEAAEIMDRVAKNYPTYEVEMRANRQLRLREAIARVEAGLSKEKSTAMAFAPAPAAAPAAPQAPPSGTVVPLGTPPAGQAAAPTGDVPSLGDVLRGWENQMRGKMLQLESEKANLMVDLNKWGQWHDWAAGEMNRVTGENTVLTKKSQALEQAIFSMQKDVDAGRAATAQLDTLRKEKVELDFQIQQNAKKLATAEQAAKDATDKLTTANTAMKAVQQERDKLNAERDKLIAERNDAMTARDTAVKERDAANAKALGMQADMDALNKKAASGSMKKLIEENERLKKDLADAQKQVETLKADVTNKEKEITKLRGDLTTLQGQLSTLRQESAQYQTQVADLTRQLKELKEMPAGPAGEASALITQENEMLRNIIMRQLRLQNRQQTAKELVIAELSKMENASADLIKQVEELKNARMTLSPEEEKLFKDPAAKELIGSNGVQATLIAASAKPDAAVSKDAMDAAKPAPGSITTLLVRASEAYSARDFATATKLYEDAIRAEPKNTTALIGLGMTHQRSSKYAESEAALQKAIAFEPDNDSAAYALAVTYFKQERWKESMTLFEKSLDKQPQNASARHYLGIISTKLSLMDRAEREFKTTLAIDPNYGDAHFNLAVLYATWDPPQWEKARTEYDQAIKKGVKPDANLEKLLDGGKKVSQN
ncbi:MAG: tetratricopeptide repeat protein [Verrucomicrobiaceae bacterium]|nr:tetratricopeptide repeat protein [Verrucomicrobiaceae bacterium]